MSRRKRMKSSTDVYHVVSRGNNKQYILENDSDKAYYRRIMKEKSEKYGVKVYAYCIMSNHVHILVKAELKMLSLFMKELNFVYAVYHNEKNGKCGHVFQNRFYSGCIETESYLVSCVRYIHNNPVNAGVISDFSKYTYSSAWEFFHNRNKKTQGYVSQEIFKILRARFCNMDDFMNFHKSFDDQEFLDIPEEKTEYDHERLMYQIERYMDHNKVTNVETLEKVPRLREDFIKRCREETGFSREKIKNFLKIAANRCLSPFEK